MNSWQKWTSMRCCLPAVCIILILQALWVTRQEQESSSEVLSWFAKPQYGWRTEDNKEQGKMEAMDTREALVLEISDQGTGEALATSKTFTQETSDQEPMEIEDTREEPILEISEQEAAGSATTKSNQMSKSENSTQEVLSSTSIALGQSEDPKITPYPETIGIQSKVTNVEKEHSSNSHSNEQAGEVEENSIPFYMYTDTPNVTCNGTEAKENPCSECKRGEDVLNYLREQQTDKEDAELFVMSLDFLALSAHKNMNISSQLTSALDRLTKTKQYLHYGGSDNILLCLLPGCAQVLQEITARHPLGRDTRAMWVTVPSELRVHQGELWPCPDRVLLASYGLVTALESNSSKEGCMQVDKLILDQEIKKLLSMASEKIRGGNRWKCSKERWNVDLSHLKGVPDQGCQEISRHQICISSIPKCATSTIDALVRRMNGNSLWNTSKRYSHGGPGLHWSSAVKKYEAYEKLYTNTSHIKILVVRNPDDRFFSAYMDKIYSLHEFGRIGYHGRSVPTLDAVAEHFYRVDLKGRMARIDKHFRPIHTFASIGSIRYDFVARVESLSEDLVTILTSLGLYDTYLASGWGPHQNLSFAEDMGGNIGHKPPPSIKYSAKSLKQVRSIYKEDYDRFDYRIE